MQQIRNISISVFLWGVCLLPVDLAAQYNNIRTEINEKQGVFQLQHYPTIRAGSHINYAGYVVHPSLRFLEKEKGNFTIGLESHLKVKASKLGIPGSGVNHIYRASLSYAMGDPLIRNQQFQLPGPGKTAVIKIYYAYYSASDNTSQPSAGFLIGRVSNNRLFRMQYENDFFTFHDNDQFRTSALSFDIFQNFGNNRYGIGFEKLLWTGTTAGLEPRDAGEIYPMEGQLGSAYSHGVLAARLHFRNLSLKIGYDSESIRAGIQNNFHTLINDGIIPGGSKSRDRLFIQLSIDAINWLY